MKLSAHLLQGFAEDLITQLRSLLAPTIRLTVGPDLPERPDFQILIAGRPEREHLVASPDLQTLIIPWAGLPDSTCRLLQEFPHLRVHNLHHNAVPAAEMAIALLLTAAKGILPADRALREGDWTPRYEADNSILLRGKTALVLGYGAIGSRIAAACLALGMEVIAVKRHRSGGTADKIRVYAVADLQQLLPNADVLFVSLPLTPETREIIGADELSLLPQGAVVINIGRGPVIEEAALFKALQNNRISAGLDVWYSYPATAEARSNTQPSRFPFHRLNNVVMSPHVGGHSDETEALRARGLAEMLNTAAAGRPLPNPVDLQRGY